MSERDPARPGRSETTSVGTGSTVDGDGGGNGGVITGTGGFAGGGDVGNGGGGGGDGDAGDESTDRLAERVDAIERAITGDDADVDRGDRAALESRGALESRVVALEGTIDTIEQRLEELDAATQAVRGYVGGVRAVDREIESRADLALAKATRLEEGQTGPKRPRETAPTGEPHTSTRHTATNRKTATTGSTDTDGSEPTSRWSEPDDGETAVTESTETAREATDSRPDRPDVKRTGVKRTDGGQSDPSYPPAAAAAVPDADEVGRVPDLADDTRETPESGVLARLRDVL
ncbi:hypothetical protein SAMN05192561_101237 [Halopenitus malekzadehii]|uniref:DUF7310 domain-containing protein n=1 Tax=Halopenitus malekzadehii TaxID=1267564 RepID=A0A1H6HRH8_9EURY|nr:hypothetical protein [Halopenitus malekzadehii]SEH37662.1 hypothetical protein SAMN05192561_101237 [Halopenitus malekzadehii]